MSGLPKLSLNKNQLIRPSMHTLGMGYFLRSLRDSGLFNISEHESYLYTFRDFRATILYIGGKKVYLDFWEYPAPLMTDPVYNANFDLIIKLQWKRFNDGEFVAGCRKSGFLKEKSDEEINAFYKKIVPWTFFPSRLCEPYIGKEKELWCNDIKRNGFFCGKDWKSRRWGKKAVANLGMEYTSSDQEAHNIIPDEKFIAMMKESKFGIILPGRASWCTEAKNRREIDYMMMKKPILMPYSPYYYNELKEGVHFIRLDKHKTVEEIEQAYDLNAIAANGYKWYLDNASPNGLASTFIKIVREKLGDEVLQG